MERRADHTGPRQPVTRLGPAGFGPLAVETFQTIEDAERSVDERFMLDDFFTGAAIDIIWRADGEQVESRRCRDASSVASPANSSPASTTRIGTSATRRSDLKAEWNKRGRGVGNDAG